jgi:hypothetical protein
MARFASRIALRLDGAMGTKSRETIYGSSVRASAERARAARLSADRLRPARLRGVESAHARL